MSLIKVEGIAFVRFRAHALIRAGRELFAERAVDAVAIDDIVQAADVAKGSFYNHFPDREALVRAVVQAIRPAARPFLRPPPPPSAPAPTGRLRASSSCRPALR